MKYRVLHIEELETVRDEFVKFLAVNSINAEDWIKMKTEQVQKTIEYIEQFSDLFWEKSLQNIKCVEFRQTHQIIVFHFGENEGEMVELKMPENEDADLTDPEYLRKLAEGKLSFTGPGPELYTATKKNIKDRNLELFELIEKGARPCPETFFYGLKAMAGDK